MTKIGKDCGFFECWQWLLISAGVGLFIGGGIYFAVKALRERGGSSELPPGREPPALPPPEDELADQKAALSGWW
jgi:hypothetical protein